MCCSHWPLSSIYGKPTALWQKQFLRHKGWSGNIVIEFSRGRKNCHLKKTMTVHGLLTAIMKLGERYYFYKGVLAGLEIKSTVSEDFYQRDNCQKIER